MAQTADERRKPPSFGLALAIIFGLLLIYVLSIGPAYRLLYQGRLRNDVFKAAYSPVISLSKQSATAEDALGCYVRFWALL